MRWTALLVLLASCSGTNEAPEPVFALRLGTHFGLAVMDPTVSGTFTVNVIDLVYKEPLSSYFTSARAEGPRVLLTPRSERHPDLERLAASFAHPELVRAYVEGQQLVVVLRSAEAAAGISLEQHLVLDGPYKVDESTEERLVLERRQPAEGVGRLEVTSVASAEEEWRRLISGEFDAMLYVPPSAGRYLEKVPTLRLVRLRQVPSAAVWFHMNGGPMKDATLRRAVAALIRRKPLALSVIGNSEGARVDEGDQAQARAALLAAGYVAERPLELRVLVYDAMTDLVRTAMVLQQQLGSFGIDIRIDSLPAEQYFERVNKHDFDLLLFVGDRGPRYWARLQQSPDGNMNGYASDEFDAAARDNDEVRARQILDRDLPLTPLFGMDESVAVSRDLCNVHPVISSDLSWLADVRRCRPGEDE